MNPKIEIIEDIQQLVAEGFTDWKTCGEVNAVYHDGLVLFNYTDAAEFSGNWNSFERMSRGLILDATTGYIVARPFDKFFNWIPDRGDYTTADIDAVIEKMDGSLGILYRWGDEYRVATRGSFTSEQALWATEYLNMHYDLSTLPYNLTLLFEIIYPGNKVVVDYASREDLVLIGGRYFDGSELTEMNLDVHAKIHGFTRPKVYYDIEYVDVINDWQVAKYNNVIEGWVVRFDNGSRFKFKTEQYRELHRIMFGATFKRIRKAMIEGRIDEMEAEIPQLTYFQFLEKRSTVEQIVADIVRQVAQALIDRPPNILEAAQTGDREARKRYATWVQKNYKHLAPYLFRISKSTERIDIRPMVTEDVFKSIKEE